MGKFSLDFRTKKEEKKYHEERIFFGRRDLWRRSLDFLSWLQKQKNWRNLEERSFQEAVSISRGAKQTQKDSKKNTTSSAFFTTDTKTRCTVGSRNSFSRFLRNLFSLSRISWNPSKQPRREKREKQKLKKRSILSGNKNGNVFFRGHFSHRERELLLGRKFTKNATTTAFGVYEGDCKCLWMLAERGSDRRSLELAPSIDQNESRSSFTASLGQTFQKHPLILFFLTSDAESGKMDSSSEEIGTK